LRVLRRSAAAFPEW